MEGKQTAVEFLFRSLWQEPKDKMVWFSILKQAEAIEKEQIMHAHEKAYIDMNLSFRSADRAEEYYNETYMK
jgi:hypothetical protein